MPKTKIEAKKVLDDIKAGLDDAALMEKYNLSTKGLHSVLEKLVALKTLDESFIWTGRPPRGSGTAQANREVSAKGVTKDIRSGMTDGDLMRKYRLSAKGLQNLLEQLIEAGVIKESDLEQGKPIMESTVELTSDMLPPIGDSALAAKTSQALSAEIAPPPEETPPPPEKPQEVQIVESTEPAFPSTVPITAVTEPEAEKTVATPALTPVPEKAEEPTRQEPSESSPEPPREPAVRDIWATSASVSEPGERTVTQSPSEVEPASPPTTPVEEESVPEDYEQTIELIWKCPACGQPQTHAYDECPICGIVVSKFGGHQEKSSDVLIRTDAKKPEPKVPSAPPPAIEPPASEPAVPATPAPEPPVPEPPLSVTPKPRPAPAAPRNEPSIKPRRQPTRPPVVHEEVGEPEHAPYGWLSGTLTYMAMAQFMVVIGCVGVGFYLDRSQPLNFGRIAWSMVVPVVISGAVWALLHSAAVLVKLASETLTATTQGHRVLREILEKLDKHTS